jgi:hypothetical protein
MTYLDDDRYAVPDGVEMRYRCVVETRCIASLRTGCLNIARQGIHSHRITAENIRQPPQVIHHVKPHTGF